MAVTQVLGTDKALRLNNYNTLGLVQNFNWAPNFNAQDVNELGRTTRVDTLLELETSGSFELQSPGNLAGVLARMKTEFSAGQFNGYKYNPVASGTTLGSNGYTFTQDDLAQLKFDAIIHEKTEQSTFNRSVYLGCCYPTTIAGRVDANGMAMDTINWAGQFVVGFPTPYHDIRSVSAKYATSTTATLLDVTYSTASNWKLAYVSVEGIPFTAVAAVSTANIANLAAPGSTFAVGTPVAGDRVLLTGQTTTSQNGLYRYNGAASPLTLLAGAGASYAVMNTTTISLYGGASIPSGAHVQAVVFKAVSPTTSWSSVHTPDTIGAGATLVSGIRGFQANVYIAPANPATPTGTEQWLKVQSLDYNIDFRVEALRQIAFNTQGSSIYSRVPTFPFQTSVNATVNEADWADWKQLLNSTKKTFNSSNDWYDNTYDFAPDNLDSTFSVVIDYLTKDGTRIQRLTFGDLRVDGMGSRVAVGGRGEITWSFRGSQFTIAGTNIA